MNSHSIILYAFIDPLNMITTFSTHHLLFTNNVLNNNYVFIMCLETEREVITRDATIMTRRG